MFIFAISVIVICYLMLILLYIVGWKRLETSTVDNIKPEMTVSVIVACKNEAQNIPRLLDALAAQSYASFQLILIDDNSTDNTHSIFELYRNRFSNIKLLKAHGSGKKAALKEGIMLSEAALIITTDADCSPTSKWIETIVKFQMQQNADLIICPIQFEEQKGLFSKILSLEFVSLVAAGAGAAGIGMPILCNGANLAFKREAWKKSESQRNEIEMSGDDIFLLQSIKKSAGKILFLKSKLAMVTTTAPASIGIFVKQRQRWAGKSPSYTDYMTIFTAIIVLAISLLQIGLFVLSIRETKVLILVISIFAIKYIADTFLLYTVKSFFELQRVWFYSLLLSLVYPLYISFVGITALAKQPSKWK